MIASGCTWYAHTTSVAVDTEAKRHCEFFYEMLNAEWASSVNCSVLPDSTDGNVCVGGREVQALAETTGIGLACASLTFHFAHDLIASLFQIELIPSCVHGVTQGRAIL